MNTKRIWNLCIKLIAMMIFCSLVAGCSSSSSIGVNIDDDSKIASTAIVVDAGEDSSDVTSSVVVPDENKSQIIPTELSGTRTFKNMTYAEPTEWNPTDAESGIYYYPYAGSRNGLVYVYYSEFPCTLDDSVNDAYKDFLKGSFNKEQDTILEEKPIEISGFKAYYARGISHSSDEFDLDCEMYVVHDGSCLYGFLFVEKNSLSEEFLAYSKPIIDSIVITPPQAEATEQSQQENTQEPQEKQQVPADDGATLGQKNALKQAQSYLSFKGFSYSGLVEQLKFEGYSDDEATYAADNCGADWNEQALHSAKDYLSFKGFSASGLKSQLEYEGFTSDQAQYGVDNCGADWNEQAKKAAESYMSFTSFSRDQLISQLEFEGFSREQAEYGATAVGY